MDQDIVLLKNKAHQMNIALSDQQLAQFDIYKNELLKWNAKTNLISEKSSGEIIKRHFLDSLTALQFITKSNSRVVDIGCGAGFPGIPLKIAQPLLDIYLLEASRKKVSFLKQIVRILNLAPVMVLHDRVENVMKTDLWQNKFDIVISRAAFKLPDFILMGEYFLASEGKMIALKSSNVDEEIASCFTVKNRCKISQLIKHDIEVDFLEAPRKIIIVKK
jgi:16S rRNA (guanine527-N7)-methyltransferase